MTATAVEATTAMEASATVEAATVASVISAMAISVAVAVTIAMTISVAMAVTISMAISPATAITVSPVSVIATAIIGMPIPRARSYKDSAAKPCRAIVAIGSAGIRRISVISVSASRGAVSVTAISIRTYADTNRDLRMRVRRRDKEDRK